MRSFDEIKYIGRGWSFPPRFTKGTQNTVEMRTGVDDINESLDILMHTRLGERVMRTDYGSSIEQLLFEPIDISAAAYIKDLLTSAIIEHEPRIVVDSISVDTTPEDGRIDINVFYRVRVTNARHNFVYPFYLQEGTNL